MSRAKTRVGAGGQGLGWLETDAEDSELSISEKGLDTSPWGIAGDADGSMLQSMTGVEAVDEILNGLETDIEELSVSGKGLNTSPWGIAGGVEREVGEGWRAADSPVGTTCNSLVETSGAVAGVAGGISFAASQNKR